MSRAGRLKSLVPSRSAENEFSDQQEKQPMDNDNALPVKLEESFHQVLAIAAGCKDAYTGMTELIAYLSWVTGDFVAPLKAVDVGDDVVDVSAQLRELALDQPPPETLNAFYFGLFDTIDEAGVERIGYYVAGVDHYTPENPGSMCAPVWRPEGCYLTSRSLDAIKAAELAAAEADRPDTKNFLGYAGQLGVALIVTRFSAAGLGRTLRCVVGFDSGDVAEIDMS